LGELRLFSPSEFRTLDAHSHRKPLNKFADSKSARRQVRKVLLDLGVREPVSHERYLANLRRRFPEQAPRFLAEHDRLAAQGGEKHGLYAAKNADPDFSLAITSQEFRPIHEEFLCWVLENVPSPPRRVLDLGCESGLLSLALAKFWPETEFVRLDREAEAIRVAEQLAERGEIESARFVEGDLQSLDVSAFGKFDLILAVAVFHELMEESGSELAAPDSDGFSLDAAPMWDHGHEETLGRLIQLTGDQGLLVTLNRWAYPDRTLQWTRAVNSCGWRTDFQRSQVLRVGGRHRDDELLPVTVHLPGSPHSDDELIDGVLAIHAGPELADSGQDLEFNGAAAEAFRRALGTAQRVVGFEMEYINGSGTERIEVLASGPLAMVYQSTTRGLRKIELGTLARVPEFSARVREYKRSKEAWVDSRTLESEGAAAAVGPDDAPLQSDTLGILNGE
jgi:SAM-dependent methyltransferase